MNEEPQRRSHLWAWVLALLAAPLLYMLSVPWVGLLFIKTGHRDSPVFRAYYAPFVWMVSDNALERPMSMYVMWCFRLTGVA